MAERKGAGARRISIGKTAVLAALAVATLVVAHALPGMAALLALVAGAIVAAWIGRSSLLGLLFAAVLALGVPEAFYAPYLLGIPNFFWRGHALASGRSGLPRQAWTSILLGVSLILAALVTTLPGSGEGDFLLVQVAALVWVSVNLISARRFYALSACLPHLAAVLLGVCIVYSVESFAAVGHGGPNAWAAAGYLTGWINRNALAVVFSVVALYFLHRGLRSAAGITSLIMSTAATVATALTFSRSGYLAIVLGGIVCFYRGRKKVLLLAPLAVIGTQYLSTPVLQRIEYTSAKGGLDASSSLRLELWGAAWNLALEHPFTGVGIQSIADELRSMQFGDQLVFAHNTYLTVLASYGLVLPSLAAMALLVRALKRRHGLRDQGQLAALLSVAVSSWFGEPLLSIAVLVAVLPFLAITWTTGEPLEEESDNSAGQRNVQRGDLVPLAGPGTRSTGPPGARHHPWRGAPYGSVAARRL